MFPKTIALKNMALKNTSLTNITLKSTGLKKLLCTLAISASLVWTPQLALANPEVSESEKIPTLDQLMAEAMRHVDWQLVVRIQQAMINNMELIGPYSQEYFTCLQAEGVFDDYQGGNLKSLIEKARTTGYDCHYILQSLLGQMDMDITQEEFERGLSPEYRELLGKSL